VQKGERVCDINGLVTEAQRGIIEDWLAGRGRRKNYNGSKMGTKNQGRRRFTNKIWTDFGVFSRFSLENLGQIIGGVMGPMNGPLQKKRRQVRRGIINLSKLDLGHPS